MEKEIEREGEQSVCLCNVYIHTNTYRVHINCTCIYAHRVSEFVCV
jgi:hypothetical protein